MVEFDGRFVVAVPAARRFCRPHCGAQPAAENQVEYLPGAAAALAAGLRACPRCQPLQAPGLPEWVLPNVPLRRAVRQLQAGYLNTGGVAGLAAALGLSAETLQALLREHLGAGAEDFARACRLGLAAALLQGCAARVEDVARHSGYAGGADLRAEFKRVYGESPSRFRAGQSARHKLPPAGFARVVLPLRPPYNMDWMFAYLQRRALQGLEEVSKGPGGWLFQRRIDGGWLQVQPHPDGAPQLLVRLPLAAEPAYRLLDRVRRVFDVQADGLLLHNFMLARDELAAAARDAPGLRVPGAWDGFETAVRAVLGQQVSVERGTELANKMMSAYGGGNFPAPRQLLGRQVAELGMPGQRGRAIVYLAQAVQQGELLISDGGDYDQLYKQLVAINGIGPWTANYIRMRALKDADAFPDNDWVVLKQLQCTAARARKIAQAWQPWRAYALMHVWYGAGQNKT